MRLSFCNLLLGGTAMTLTALSLSEKGTYP